MYYYLIYLVKKLPHDHLYLIHDHLSLIIQVLLVWGILYHLTDGQTICNYFWTGFVVCACNNFIANLRKRELKVSFHVQGNWIVFAGLVLLLFHAGFDAAAIFVATAILCSPFFGATIYDSFVGLSLLVTLARQM